MTNTSPGKKDSADSVKVSLRGSLIPFPTVTSNPPIRSFSKTAQCFNAKCLETNQEVKNKLCSSCGEQLLLKERYRAVNYLGRGGFAHIFMAVDEHRFNHPCIIKQFVAHEDREALKNKAYNLFTQEAAILSELGTHPQIPSLLAFFTQTGRFYLVEEFIVGQNLLQLQQQTECFSPQQVKQILTELLSLLEFIHQHQVIHRDIKPSNIIYKVDNSLALIDFGSSLFLKPEFAQMNSITGTPGYAAPEQLQGQVYPASDLYSLGVTAWQLLTGIMPPESEIPLQWLEHTTDKILEPDFLALLTKLLQPHWSDRYQSATEVLQELKSIDILAAETNQFVATSSVNFSQPSYQKLEQLLAAKNFLQADRETWYLILQIAHRQQQGCLTITNVQQLPIQELETIDQLWLNYSNNKFGLTVQKEIYQRLANNHLSTYSVWEKFATQVGWYQSETWINYNKLTFTLDAPIGHLPACCIDVFNRAGINRNVCGWWRLGFINLMEKLK